MNRVEFSTDGEFEMAVAAAAYSIASMDEESSLNKKSPLEEMEISDLSKSKREGKTSTRIYSWFSKEANDDSKSTGDKITRKSSISDQRMQNDSTIKRKSTEKSTGTILTIKNATTFTDKYINDTGSKKFGSGNEARLGPKAQSAIKPTISSSSIEKKEGNSARSNKLETEADAWEKAKRDKIKTRYEKMKSKILDRETEKKIKAKQRLEQKQRGPEPRRAKALEEYQNEISRIDKISAEDRLLVDKRERNDELKIREMAKQMRSTGDIPHACVCF
ncbi:uro-adherence factor A-like isoform X3 [Phoenix dactylifera]|uniref:Uro-adherence factor A-like isoform X3 n=1 Tax=Phoenix dactylifera TaxID=42345 RepID=A0A8B7BGB2_PHODC|nr:uro-adherence factor A-like isoform X3 [Phoenix dactylifera]XP_038972694.1 uro-adherence factor A-like isoform X3 [Phoenix dactylifera]